MKEQELLEFIEWIPKNIKEFANHTQEQIVEALNKLGQSEEGKSAIQQMVEMFQKSKRPVFKKGGSVNTPYGVINENDEGRWIDTDGRDVDYRQGRIKEWLEQRNADAKFKELNMKSEGYRDSKGNVYTRTTYWPSTLDTIVTMNGKSYNNGFFEFLKSKLGKSTKFDEINKRIDSLKAQKFYTGGPIEEYQKPTLMPWDMAFYFAKAFPLKSRQNTIDKRSIKRVRYKSGEVRDRIIKENNTSATATTERRIKDGDTVFIYNARKFHPGDDMYDRYQNAWKEYGVYNTK